jgi:hypothetical protein
VLPTLPRYALTRLPDHRQARHVDPVKRIGLHFQLGYRLFGTGPFEQAPETIVPQVGAVLLHKETPGFLP